MLLKVEPALGFHGTFCVPPSKPETQRAILTSALAHGRSRIFHDLRCDETEVMKRACRAMGAEIIECDDSLEIHGVGGALRYDNRVIDAAGSALAFRVFAALSSAQRAPVIITGDETLRRRVMSPLFDALRELGANIQPICGDGCAPIVNWGRGLRGGHCRLPGDVSSQFVTAILLAAPFAEEPVEIEVTSEVFSKSYITQTLAGLSGAGISFEASADYRYFRVEPSFYRPYDKEIAEDYTSASYLLAAAALFKGRSVFTNVHGGSAQGESAIIRILDRLGLSITFNRIRRTLTVDNPDGAPRGDFEIDARDCPNIVPTLAAIGAYVKGTLRVVGARLTRLHKASRIEAMVSELSRAGVDITLIHDQGVCDGFEVRGAPSYPGGCTFSSWGDHRIFMSLFVASLRMKQPCFFSGFDGVRLSFPEFFSEFAKAGVVTSILEEGAQPPRSVAPRAQRLVLAHEAERAAPPL